MNPVLILTHNCLELTKKCVESVRNQDISTRIYITDNGSTDGTKDWVFDNLGLSIYSYRPFPHNFGVSIGWNRELNALFSELKPHCLVVNNDTILPPWFYSELLGYNFPFVTGVAVDQMSQIQDVPSKETNPTPNPDFSAFLIRREAWEKIGPFDERMKLYASDCDYHIRGHRILGRMGMVKVNCPYYHERSSTLKKATPEERREIEAQANRDREVFRSIYGCLPGEPAYYALFGEGTDNAKG